MAAGCTAGGGQVTNMGEVAAAIRAVIDQLRDSHNALTNARQGLDSATGRMVDTTEGSSSSGPSTVAAALSTASEAATRSQNQVRASVDALNRYLADVGAESSTGVSADRPSVGQPPAPAVVDPVGHDAPVPSYVRRFVEALSPPPAGTKVAGIACTRDGTPLHDPTAPLTNGRRGGFAGVANARTLSRQRVGDARLPLYSQLDVALTHVEGHTAARMREPGAPQEVVLTVTREPCPGELGCDAQLSNLLPKGSVLHVYVAERGHQARHFDSYTGNGKGTR